MKEQQHHGIVETELTDESTSRERIESETGSWPGSVPDAELEKQILSFSLVQV